MDEPFHLHGGGVIAGPDELESSLVDMDPAVFAFHTRDGNDFASWIEFSLGKPLLAALVRECETSHETAVVLETYRVLRETPEKEILVSDIVRRLVPRFS